jgi:hypothetical protein
MQELETYAKNITDRLDLPEATKNRIEEETIAHLEEGIQHCLAKGLSQEDALHASIEKFGKEDVMAKLVSDALSNKQRRFRLQRALQMFGVAVLLIILTVVVGAWFNFFDDMVSGLSFARTMPDYMRAILYLGGAIGCIVVLSLIARKLFHTRMILVIFSALFVLFTFFVTVLIFKNITLLREKIGVIHGDETFYISLRNAFLMRLYLCWVPTTIIGIAGLLLTRKRKCILLFCSSIGIGLLSAGLCGINRLRGVPWLNFMKWPKLLSTGLLALVFVILVGLLSVAITNRSKAELSGAGRLCLKG